jgi:NAD(P)-dependent dehydrogenase (short-subunit alcohol dehydrogenase family)
LIALGSVSKMRPLARRSAYAASKSALIGLVRTASVDLGPSGIRVNLVSPGPVDGPRIEGVIERIALTENADVAEVRRRFTDPAALQRMVSADEVAQACIYLASDAASGITGQDVHVNAGLFMH